MTLKTYLPNIHTGEEGSRPDDEVAWDLARMIATHPEQQRQQLTVAPVLNDIAAGKADAMRKANELSHTIGGVSANDMVRQSGWELPPFYGEGPEENNIESIASGFTSPRDVLDAWLGSEPHKRHILGVGPFYSGQSFLGVGYTSQVSPDGWGPWWVVILTHRRGDTW